MCLAAHTGKDVAAMLKGGHEKEKTDMPVETLQEVSNLLTGYGLRKQRWEG